MDLRFELVLRLSGLPEVLFTPWELTMQANDDETHSDCFSHLAFVPDGTARTLVRIGSAKWLDGEPDWNERKKARILERARKMEETAAEIRSDIENGNIAKHDFMRGITEVGVCDLSYPVGGL